MVFVDDSYFDSTFETPAGTVRLLADVHIFARHLVLDEIMVYNAGSAEPLQIGVGHALAVRQHLCALALDQGFEELTVVLHRVGKRHTGRTMTYTRRLS